jgi:hypothetical protein
MKFKGQIIFWAAIITLPISFLTGDFEGVILSLSIIGLATVLVFLFSMFKS